jgi:hypothetical protein
MTGTASNWLTLEAPWLTVAEVRASPLIPGKATQSLAASRHVDHDVLSDVTPEITQLIVNIGVEVSVIFLPQNLVPALSGDRVGDCAEIGDRHLLCFSHLV